MKLKMRDDLSQAFADGKRYFQGSPETTAKPALCPCRLHAEKYRWEFGGPITGHLIGQVPH
jgi:hypothetical protein